MAVDYAGHAGPYAAEVVARLRHFPHEIEADFEQVYHRDIVDFWRHVAVGADDPNPKPLTGRKVLALLEELRDTSRFKTMSERDGDWPEWMYILAGGPNELKMSRADQAAYHGKHMSADLFESPRQRQDSEDALKLSRAAHDHLVAQMSSGSNEGRAPRHRQIIRETDVDDKRQVAEIMRRGRHHA